MTQDIQWAAAVLLDEADDVAVVLDDIAPGMHIRPQGRHGRPPIEAREEIPRFHKVAMQRIAKGQSVKRNACVIGIAVTEIEAGAWVHVHNLHSLRRMQAQALDA